MEKFKKESDEPIYYTGFSKIRGGVIPQDVVITGMSEISAHIECGSIEVSGTLSAKGNVFSHGKIANSGLLKVAGATEVLDGIDSSGSSTFTGFVTSHGPITSTGLLKYKNGLDLKNDGVFSGATTSNSTVNVSGTVEFKGMTKIQGDLIAKSAKIWPIQLGLNITALKNWTQPTVRGDILVEDQCELKQTKVYGEIYSHNIKIGEECELIGTVHYVDRIEVDSTAILAHDPVQISKSELDQRLAQWIDESSEAPEKERQPQFCPGCGEPLEEPVRFCPFCGMKLSS